MVVFRVLGGVAVEIYILKNTHTRLDKIDFLHVHSSVPMSADKCLMSQQ